MSAPLPCWVRSEVIETHIAPPATAIPPAPPLPDGRVPLPVYRGTVIYVCPGCDGDLQHEGDGYWCPACRQSWSFAQIGLYEDEDPYDD